MINGMQGHMNGDAAYHRCNQDCNQGRECDCTGSDLVKRLRFGSNSADDDVAFETLENLVWEAADEIERLRKQRDELVAVLALLANACKDEGVRGMDNLISKCDAYLAKIEGEKNADR